LHRSLCRLMSLRGETWVAQSQVLLEMAVDKCSHVRTEGLCGGHLALSWTISLQNLKWHRKLVAVAEADNRVRRRVCWKQFAMGKRGAFGQLLNPCQPAHHPQVGSRASTKRRWREQEGKRQPRSTVRGCWLSISKSMKPSRAAEDMKPRHQ
jgi:hypothetical protein